MIIVLALVLVVVSHVCALSCPNDLEGVRRLLLQNCDELANNNYCRVELHQVTSAFKNGTYGWHLCPTTCNSCNEEYNKWKGESQDSESGLLLWHKLLITSIGIIILLAACFMSYRIVKRGEQTLPTANSKLPPSSGGKNISQLEVVAPNGNSFLETSSSSSVDFGLQPTPDNTSHQNPLSRRLLNKDRSVSSETPVPQNTNNAVPNQNGSRPRTSSQRRPPAYSTISLRNVMSKSVGQLRLSITPQDLTEVCLLLIKLSLL